jgi:phage-related protein
MNRIFFLGDTLDQIRDFSTQARNDVGTELRRVQSGLEPDGLEAHENIGRWCSGNQGA